MIIQMIIEKLDVIRNLVGMLWPEFVSTIGAAFGFLGGILLAFAAHGELSAHRLAIDALRCETGALVEAYRNPTSPLIRVTGTNTHMDSGRRWKTWFTWSGVGCLAASLGLTVLAFFVVRH